MGTTAHMGELAPTWYMGNHMVYKGTTGSISHISTNAHMGTSGDKVLVFEIGHMERDIYQSGYRVIYRRYPTYQHVGQ